MMAFKFGEHEAVLRCRQRAAELAGNYDEAETMCRSALAIKENTLGVQVKSERKKKKKRKTKRGSKMKRDSDAGRLAAAPPLPAAPSPHEPDGLCERLGFSWCSSAPPAPTPSEPVDFKQADHTEPQGDAAVSISMEV